MRHRRIDEGRAVWEGEGGLQRTGNRGDNVGGTELLVGSQKTRFRGTCTLEQERLLGRLAWVGLR